MSNWGWYRHVGPGYRFDFKRGGVDFRKTTTIDNSRLHIKFGNDFGPQWIDHNTVDNFYFYDNPELPHLINPNPSNPKGEKTWIRLVPNAILTQNPHRRGAERVNDLISYYSGKKLTWQDIVKPKPVTIKRSRRVLVCPSSANCLHYYYGTSSSDWIDNICKHLRDLGYTPLVRGKPSRLQRKKGNTLGRQIQEDSILFTVSQHSVCALESILEGVPAVTTGIHSAGALATPWQEMCEGKLRTPDLDTVEDWVDWVCGNTYHISELKEGTWRD